MTDITRRLIPIVLASAGAAVLIAGCGGGGKPTAGVGAGAGSGPPKDFASAAYKYSACMREHGVTSFPDPKVVNEPGHQAVGIHVTPAMTGSPAFAAAHKACNSILPDSGPSNVGPSPQQVQARIKGLVSFASCMRSHHVLTFPDPTTQGQLSLTMVQAAGIDLRAPAVQSAARACVPASQGQLTEAQVTRALNGQ
jgi:hypothetical protein